MLLFITHAEKCLIYRAENKKAVKLRWSIISSGVYCCLYWMTLYVNGLAKIHITASGSKEIMKEFAGSSGPILSIQSNTLYLIVGSFLISYVLTFAVMKLVKK